MPTKTPHRWTKPVWRALIEIGFIIFLFYANLLMGEFARSSPVHTLAYAVRDIVTVRSFAIANIAAFIGYGVVELLRKKL